MATSWTDARRRIVGKTLFDLLKIEVAAAFASKFFAGFTILIQALLYGLILSTALMAFFVFPKEDRRERNPEE